MEHGEQERQREAFADLVDDAQVDSDDSTVTRCHSPAVEPGSDPGTPGGFAHAATPQEVQPPGDATHWSEPDLVGRRVGPYGVLERVAEGGMGVVYRARRVNDYFQEVAIKVLRRNGASRDALRRFRRERQTLAHLAHPNIAPLLDGGTLEDGTPYLVMPFIEGQRISHYCASRQLSYAQRAELMWEVCLAVQYAHEQGVLHRDLKPSNILVTADGKPLITDFGIAKRLVPVRDGSDEEELTGSGTMMGTPQYTAPEQMVDGSQATPAADVYALGAVLYRLLTHRPPFQGSDRVETMFQVLHQTPPTPRRLVAHIPRDLETICQKCLEKNPARRYASAAELADDLERFLQHVPVAARRTSLAEQSWRWSRRNPLAASLLASLLIVLTLGLVTVTYLWRLSAHQGARLQTQARRATVERWRAETNLMHALTAMDEVTQVVEATQALDPASLGLRRQLLREALQLYERLSETNPDDTNLLQEKAVAYFLLAGLESRALAWDAAAQSADKARRLFEELRDGHPGLSGFQFDLFHCRLRLAYIREGQRRSGEAECEHLRALAIIEQISQATPDNPDVRDAWAHQLWNGARILHRRREWAEAECLYLAGAQLAEQLADDYPETPSYLRNLNLNLQGRSQLLLDQGLVNPAVSLAERAVEIAGELARRKPEIVAYHQEHFRARALLTTAYTAAGNLKEAIRNSSDSNELATQLLHQVPRNPELLLLVADARESAARLALVADNPLWAARFSRQSLNVLEVMSREFPWFVKSRQRLGRMLLTAPDPGLRNAQRAEALLFDVPELQPLLTYRLGHFAAAAEQARCLLEEEACVPRDSPDWHACQAGNLCQKLVLAMSLGRLGEAEEAELYLNQVRHWLQQPGHVHWTALCLLPEAESVLDVRLVGEATTIPVAKAQ